MKTIKVLFLTVMIFAMTGCKYKKEAEQLVIDNRDLTSQLEKSDSSLKVYGSLLNEIGARLDAAVEGDNMPEHSATGKELIKTLNATVTETLDLMKEREKNYQSLRRMYNSKNAEISEIKAEIKKLNLVIEDKENLINNLNMKITGLVSTAKRLDSRISELTDENKNKRDSIDMVTNRLNTAYYITGAENDLIDKDIVLKTGGFLGFLGRVMIINPQLDKKQLVKINLLETTIFNLPAGIKNIEFITQHPSESYEIKEVNSDSVRITVLDPEKFWEGSRYLVVAI